MIPDPLSQKVYLPTIVFLLVKMFVHLDKYSSAFIFGIAYYLSLKLLTKLSLTKQDILLPTGFFFILPSMGPVYYDAIVYMLIVAFSRMIFPAD